MKPDVPVPDRFLPPEPQAGGNSALVRWAITLIALIVLIVVAYKAYFWYAHDVAQREQAAASGKPLEVAVPPPVEVDGLTQPTASATAATTSEKIPTAAVDLGNINDPDQRRSVCGYLAAELERLNYEFKQPLPPPVIDRIATQIEQIQARTNRYNCVSDKGQQGTNTHINKS
jgi:hypothetical protein